MQGSYQTIEGLEKLFSHCDDLDSSLWALLVPSVFLDRHVNDQLVIMLANSQYSHAALYLKPWSNGVL